MKETIKKRMKKVLLAGILLVSAGLGTACKSDAPDGETTVYMPDGAPALALAKLMSEDKPDDGVSYYVVDAKTIAARVTNGDEEKNAEFAMSMNGWRTIQTEMFVWTYDGIFYAGNIPMDNWEHLKESYVNFKNCGAAYLFDQYNGTNFDFDMMRHYVRGRLMWDLSLDQEELIRHFMKHYYKEAWEKVYEYFNFFRAHTKQLEKELESKGEILDIRSFTRYNKKMAERDYWDRDYLVKSYEILNEARELTSPVSKGWRDTRFRVEMEMVTPIYLLMTLYPDTLSTEFMKEVVATYERVLTETGQITCGKYGLYFKVLSDFRAMLIDREANA